MTLKNWRGAVALAFVALTALAMQPLPASAQSTASGEQSAHCVVYSFSGKEDGSQVTNLVRLEDGTMMGSTGGHGTIFQLVGDEVKTLERFDLKNATLIRSLYPLHGNAVIVQAASSRSESGQRNMPHFYRFSPAEGLKPLPEQWNDFQSIAPATSPDVIHGIDGEGGIFRYDESTGDLQQMQSHVLQNVREGGDGYVYAIGKASGLPGTTLQLLRWTEDLRQCNVLHKFERAGYPDGDLVLPGNGKIYGAMYGGPFVFEIGCDGSEYREILGTTGKVLGLEGDKVYVLTNRTLDKPSRMASRPFLYVVDLETGESREVLRDLWTPPVTNHRIAFMADHALWGFEEYGGEHHKGSIFRIRLP